MATRVIELRATYAARVRQFFAQPFGAFGGSAWIESEEIRCYFRRAKRRIRGEERLTVEVANVIVCPGRNGLYSALLKLVEECADGRVVYIESVPMDGSHDGIYLRRDYTKLEDPDLFCFYKFTRGPYAPKEKEESQRQGVESSVGFTYQVSPEALGTWGNREGLGSCLDSQEQNASSDNSDRAE